MTPRDWLLLSSTFLIGLLCGMYLYFTTFVPEYIANPALQELVAERAPDWSLVVSEYGFCGNRDICRAFEVVSTGDYRYQPSVTRNTIETGSIPRQLRNMIDTTITESPLYDWMQPITANCTEDLGRTHYEITITTTDGVYILDTCASALPQQSELAQLVTELLLYMDAPASYTPPARNDGEFSGLAGIIERIMSGYFSPYAEQ